MSSNPISSVDAQSLTEIPEKVHQNSSYQHLSTIQYASAGTIRVTALPQPSAVSVIAMPVWALLGLLGLPSSVPLQNFGDSKLNQTSFIVL